MTNAVIGGGLSQEEAARRLTQYGANLVPQPPPAGIASRVFAQLRDPMILLLCGASSSVNSGRTSPLM